MRLTFIDTDVIIRFIAGDDEAKREASAKLFAEVEEGEQVLACPVTTIADAVYVLGSRNLYALDRTLVAQSLQALVALPHFHVSDRPIVQRALEIYSQTRLDFGDTMIIAAMEEANITTLYSYDRDFDRISQIIRQEP